MSKYFRTSFYHFITESRFTIPKIKLKGEFYHGSVIEKGDELFDRFELGYSDWDAIWLTDEEHIAEEFSGWRSFGADEEINLVYRVEIDLKAIANISYELSMEMMEKWGLSDFRESIPLLEQRGYTGWVVPGSIGDILYQDVAIFNPDDITIVDVKLKVDGEWTEYMDLEDVQEFLDNQ